MRTAERARGPDPGPSQSPSTIGRYEALDRIAADGLGEMLRLVADLCEVEQCVLGLCDATRGPDGGHPPTPGLDGGHPPTPGLIRTVIGAAPEEAPSYVPLLTHATLEGGLVVVPDTLAVPSLAAEPLVTSGAARFFAGVPVRGEGGALLGVIGLFDPSPRRLPDRAAAAFRGLARQVGVQLELRRRVDSVREKHIEHLDALHVLAGLLGAATTLAIIGTDPAGRITTFSEGAERLLEVPAAQVVARASPVVFLDPGELEACVREATRDLGRKATGFEALVATAASGAGKGERAWTMRRPTGATFPASVVVGPVQGEHGELGGYVVIAQDISERRAIERMKDEFIGAVSHELRTPLTSMLGALGLVRGGVAGEVSPGVAELVGIAHANGERLLRLVNDLLDAQKLASGRFDLLLAPCDPADVVARAIELTLPLAETAGVLLGTVEGAWEIGRGSSPDLAAWNRGSAPPGGAPSLAQGGRILADFDRLVQVVVNLLSNAIKFSPSGEQVTVGCERRGDAVRISVTDRGPGIPESFRGRIFGRFMQASVSDATTRRGTGLGLSIAKSITELHGGTLGFDTETGKGTTFHVDLPATF